VKKKEREILAGTKNTKLAADITCLNVEIRRWWRSASL